MARSGKGNRAGKRGKMQIPRAPGSNGTVATIRRIHNAGNLPRVLGDQGQQFGTVPGSTLDWASMQAVWARYRLLRVTNHFILNGEFDTTPAYPTLFVYHDFVSAGAPASVAEALLKRGVKQLAFGSTAPRHSFQYVPFVWTSAGFATQIPAPQARYQTATAFAPVFSSTAVWGLNYNTTVGSAPILLVQEFLIEFSEPV